MSATGTGGCGPGPGPASGPGSGASNPRKFSEKIALHTQRQAEETAAFQEVMMDITSTRLQAQKLRLARNQGPYYGGSLPNVNQIGRNPQDFQVSFPSSLESSRSTRHHGLVERVQRDRRFMSPVRPYRNRQVDNSLYNNAYLSPPPDASWRRNWSGNFPGDKGQFRLPTTALNRTNSDSALHTSVMNPQLETPSPWEDRPSPPRAADAAVRVMGKAEEDSSPPAGDHVCQLSSWVLRNGKLLKPWETKKLPLLSSRPKSCEVPGINVFTSPEQPSTPSHSVPSALNTGGSLPDLSSLHFPSPLPTPLDLDEPGFPGPSSLSGGSSTGNLASTLTQLGINAANVAGGNGSFHHAAPGLLSSLQSSPSNPSLQSSLSNPNIQASLSSHSFSNSLSSASLHSSLSNPSLQSSLSSSPSLPSSLSSQSLHSSLSNSSLQSVSGSNYSGSVGGSGTGSSFSQTSLSTSPRRRAQLSPLILPMGVESRRHHSKQFSPIMSPTLSSITQGVPLDTSKLLLDQPLPPYPLSQPHQQLPQSHQPAQMGQHHQQHLHRGPHPRPGAQQLQNLQNFRNQHLQHFGGNQAVLGSQVKTESVLDPCLQNPPSVKPEAEPQHQQGSLAPDLYNRSHESIPCPPIVFCLSQPPGGALLMVQSDDICWTDELTREGLEAQKRGFWRTSDGEQSSEIGSPRWDALFSSLMDDPYLSLQLSKSRQQFLAEHPADGPPLHHGDKNQLSCNSQGAADQRESGNQQLLNNQNQNYSCGEGRHNVPNIILTGDSPTGLSKEIASALSNVPGFEMDSFSLDETLRMDPLSLDMLESDLMLADPAVEDSFRSDRLK
ncbi:hypothetical protein OJAV_G00164160 [Oryzias javanicus]|uniref:CREB regulated transcription coactivator 2 n=1 Tax=Oryzias javanicus TaxID=123683 RepID=A0A3S2U5J8_ORYJA|nr:hypothetical protein OJAV_G00164160 [Oryzias javanicus]